MIFFFSSRRRHTRFDCDWSSDVCSSDLSRALVAPETTTTGSRSTWGSVLERTGRSSASPRMSGRERSRTRTSGTILDRKSAGKGKSENLGGGGIIKKKKKKEEEARGGDR